MIAISRSDPAPRAATRMNINRRSPCHHRHAGLERRLPAARQPKPAVAPARRLRSTCTRRSWLTMQGFGSAERLREAR